MILIIIVLFCASCASVMTTVENPQGEIFTIKSKKDALVTLKQGDTELTVDNRGKMGIFENLMGILLMKTDINLKNKDGD